jgi:hypothetical protein
MAYGRVVSEPSGRSSSKNVTAATRPDPAVARALRLPGFAILSGPRYSTLGASPTGAAIGVEERSQPVEASTATASKRRVRTRPRTEPSKRPWPIW